MGPLFELLRSRKLAVGLFILISCLAVLGTLVPQTHLTSPESYQVFLARYGFLARLAQALGLTALYYSWWYYALVLLLLANTTVCTAGRLRQAWRVLTSPPRIKDGRQIQSMPGCRRISWPALDGPWAAERVADIFRSRGYKVGSGGTESEPSVVAWKGQAGPLGSVIFHLSFIPILLGILSMTLFGLRGVFLIDERQTWREGHSSYLSLTEGYLFGERHPRFDVTLNSVKPRFSGLDLVDLTADVSASDGTGATKKAIRVNEPLSYQGFLVLLSSYGFAPVVKITEGGVQRAYSYMNLGAHGIESLVFRDRFSVPGGLEADLRFYPDAVAKGRRIEARSLSPRSPVLSVTLARGGRSAFDGAVALGQTVKQGGIEVSFLDWHYYAIFKMVRDPGWSVLIGGFLMALAGLALRASLAYRRFWVAGEVRGGELELLLVGTSDKYGTLFQQELGSVLSRMRELGEKEV